MALRHTRREALLTSDQWELCFASLCTTVRRSRRVWVRASCYLAFTSLCLPAPSTQPLCRGASALWVDKETEVQRGPLSPGSPERCSPPASHVRSPAPRPPEATGISVLKGERLLWLSKSPSRGGAALPAPGCPAAPVVGPAVPEGAAGQLPPPGAVPRPRPAADQ